MALNHASQIVHWQENLLPDDFPPEWMLPFDDELEAWFQAVADRRNSNKPTPELDDSFDIENELLPKRR